ncbi:DNA-directed RNA polymerase [uncultured Hyphomicrobium sp.]|jgi:DNA-directed RNA polymerase|uniref:DNA-directed RNA polymerase n=1 Tax=uncultured Hyphomicrobium sp. TaxID=194373 RepID=UPI0025E52375|nr:DNA-directed RNA polymerase [uncultured Hyphomicrobium sp.]
MALKKRKKKVDFSAVLDELNLALETGRLVAEACDPEERRLLQIESERADLTWAMGVFDLWLHEMDEKGSITPAEKHRLKEQGVAALADVVKRELEPRQGKSHIRARYSELTAKQISVATVTVAMRAAERGNTLVTASENLAALLDEELALKLEKKPAALRRRDTAGTVAAKKETPQGRRARLAALRVNGNDDLKVKKERIAAGHKLMALAVTHCDLFEWADSKSKRDVKKLKMRDDVPEALQEWRKRSRKYADGDTLPLIVPPLPWIGLDVGGYHLRKKKCIKVWSGSQWGKSYCDAFAKNPPMAVLDGLTKLQSTAWAIDERFLSSVGKVLAELNYTGTSEHQGNWQALAADDDGDDSDDDVAVMGEVLVKTAESIRHIIARATDYWQLGPRFYYVWQLDYRGRAYPIGKHVTPQASDLSSGLLTFADSKPLGNDGRYWLALHGANVLGPKLRDNTLDARVNWIETHEAEIIAAARDPLGHLAFWSGSEGTYGDMRRTSWRGLRFCQEWSRMVEKGSRFESSLPVSIDGTCNGIQHLAALTQNGDLARQVNMRRGTAKGDIYDAVARHTIALIEKDSGPETERLRSFLVCVGLVGVSELVDRDMCKKPVMTQPYGVTGRGIDQAIYEKMQERFGRKAAFWQFKEGPQVCLYLRKKLVEALAGSLGEAAELMTWLQTASDMQVKAKLPVCWTTHLGLPIMQAQVKEEGDKQQTQYRLPTGQVTTTDVTWRKPTDRLDLTENRRAIVANFVHSQDGTHMLMTTIAAWNAGVRSLRMVHDSFGTHAGDMATLSRLTRECFEQLYEDGRAIERFKAGLNGDIAEAPKGSGLDIREVLEAPYFFC